MTNECKNNPAQQGDQPPPPYGYYPMPYQMEQDEINLLDYWRVLVNRKWLVFVVTTIATVIALTIALTSQPIYKADVLLAPANDDKGGMSNPLAQFGGLASMVGINVGGGGNAEHALAVLKSRSFLEKFILEEKIMPALFPSLWDEEKQQWKDDAAVSPTMWSAYKKFSGILRTSVAKDSGLITVSIEWSDPELAAKWANLLVERLNQHLKATAISEATNSIEYLKGQIQETTVVEMQQILFRLIEAETKKIMLANVRDQYAFKVIDPAVTPEEKIKPKRSLIVILGFIAGLMSGVFLAFFLSFIEKQRSMSESAE